MGFPQVYEIFAFPGQSTGAVDISHLDIDSADEYLVLTEGNGYVDQGSKTTSDFDVTVTSGTLDCYVLMLTPKGAS